MMATIIDRDISVDFVNKYFSVGFDYIYDGYIDPDSGEDFTIADWNIDYTEPDGFTNWSSGSDFGNVGYAYGDFALDTTTGVFVGNLYLDISYGFVTNYFNFRVFDAALERSAVTINGSSLDDIVIGGYGNDTIRTGNGDDVIYGGAGSDTMTGGAGADTYIVGSGDKIYERVGDAGNDSVKTSVTYSLLAGQSIEKLTTIDNNGAAKLNLYGNERSQTIIGNAGVNFIDGKEGNDVINGSFGKDILNGGAGNDYFVFDTVLSSNNIDRIKDFNAANDTFRLDDLIFSEFTRPNKISATEFALVSSASSVVSSNAHILYNKSTGTLYYDENGGSAADRIAFAVLDNKADISYNDFYII